MALWAGPSTALSDPDKTAQHHGKERDRGERAEQDRPPIDPAEEIERGEQPAEQPERKRKRDSRSSHRSRSVVAARSATRSSPPTLAAIKAISAKKPSGPPLITSVRRPSSMQAISGSTASGMMRQQNTIITTTRGSMKVASAGKPPRHRGREHREQHRERGEDRCSLLRPALAVIAALPSRPRRRHAWRRCRPG